MSSRENSSPAWTYRMEVSPTGQGPAPVVPSGGDPVAMFHMLLNLNAQILEALRQLLDNQRQQLELAREAANVAREQRTRQMNELERWQAGHEGVIEPCREALGQLEQVHSALMGELAEYVAEHHEHLMEGDFALTEFVDRFGPRLAHLNTMLAILRPLTAVIKKSEG